MKIKTALLSVSDKDGIVEFAQALAARGVRLLSTGGTAKLLAQAGLKVTEVAKHTTAERHQIVRMVGEEPTPLQRTAVAADFANGISYALSFETHAFINPDLTITLHRLPVDEWFRVVG